MLKKSAGQPLAQQSRDSMLVLTGVRTACTGEIERLLVDIRISGVVDLIEFLIQSAASGSRTEDLIKQTLPYAIVLDVCPEKTPSA